MTRYEHRLRRWRFCATVLALTFGACDRTKQAPNLPRWTAVEDLRIGSADNPEQSFQFVGDLTVSPNGIIYAAIPNDHNVRVYDSNGALITTIGRLGTAPGELTSPYRLGSIRSLLWVYDAANQRVTLFHATGAFAQTADPMVNAPKLAQRRFSFHWLLSDGSTLARVRPLEDSPPGTTLSIPVVRLLRGGAADTIASTNEVSAALIVRDPNAPESSGFYTVQPFAGLAPVTVTSTDGMIVIADPVIGASGVPAYRLSKLNLVGDTVFTTVQQREPTSVPKRIVDARINAIAATAMNSQARAPTMDVQKEWVRRALYVPEFAPPVTGLIAGSDGTLYVRHADPGGERVDWTVFSAFGEPIAQFTTPANLRFLAADAAHLYGTSLGELDVPMILRYRLRRSS